MLAFDGVEKTGHQASKQIRRKVIAETQNEKFQDIAAPFRFIDKWAQTCLDSLGRTKVLSKVH